jgi:hypothetical protein
MSLGSANTRSRERVLGDGDAFPPQKLQSSGVREAVSNR